MLFPGSLRWDSNVGSSGNQWVEQGKDVYHYARWTINPNLSQSDINYLEWIKEANPLRAKTVYYGLPGAYEGMIFADSVHKIKTQFQMKRWEEFTAGIDVDMSLVLLQLVCEPWKQTESEK